MYFDKIEFRQVAAVTLLILIFFISYVYVVYASYTPSPFFDSWRLFVEDRFFLTKLLTHNEHIINMIASVFWIDNTIFLGNGYVQLLLIAVMYVGLAVFFSSEIIRSIPGKITLAATAASVCLSATQFTNITWSFQVGFVGCFAFGLLAILSLAKADTSSTPLRWLVSSFLCCILSALGLAAGVLLFPVVALFSLLLNLRARAKVTFALSALVVAALLLHANQSGAGDLGTTHLGSVLPFAIAVLGAFPATVVDYRFLGFVFPDYYYTRIGLIAGTILIGLSLYVALKARLAWRSGAISAAGLWTLPLGLWLGLTAGAIGWGRSQMPIDEAINSRYVTISILFICALMAAAARLRLHRTNSLPLNLFCFALIALTAASQLDRMAQAEVAGRRFENAESALINGAFESPDILNLFPASMTDSARKIAQVMKARRLSVFGKPEYRLVSTPLFSGTLTYIGSCAVPISTLSAGRGWRTLEATTSAAALGKRQSILALTDAKSQVVGVGVGRKRMLGLTSEGGDHSSVLVLDTTAGEKSDLAAFLVSLTASSFCYAGDVVLR